MAEVPLACEPCLRRAWLVGRLAPYIEIVTEDVPGRRTRELLALDDEHLARAVAGADADRIAAEAEEVDIAAVREAATGASGWACCRHDSLYPGPLDGDQRPAVLFGDGDASLLGELLGDASVTVVGSRRASSYGLEVARSLAAELATAGFVVVSGLAIGIDSAAHEGALAGGGKTVAVLGAGLDQRTTPRRRDLRGRIAEEGLVLAELPPGTRAYRWTFPARNRIMAALGRMTIVVEAARHSGSLITATMASDLGRDVGAVPGRVGATLAEGTNQLLADGAKLVRGAQDVLDAIFGAGVRSTNYAPRVTLEPELAAVLELVERGNETADAVVRAGGLLPAEAAAALTRLELLGLVAVGSSGRYRVMAGSRP